MALPDPIAEPTLSIERAGALCGLGRAKSYAEARKFVETGGAEGLPAIAFGRTLRAPTAAILRLLGLDPERDDAGPVQPGDVIHLLPLAQKDGSNRARHTPA